MVGNVSRRIIAALRNRQFFSLYEINQAIKEELEKFIHRPFQKIAGNRLTAFARIDQPALGPLPATKYEYSEWKETKVQSNYHVDYDGFFYSVPYSHINQPCSVRATSATIEIYIDSQRVAVHPRNYDPFKRYTTLPEHMPENHKLVSSWNTEQFLSWAEKIGSHTQEFLRRILESQEYPIPTYRTSMGIMGWSKSYPPEVMEAASREALDKNIYSYKYFSMILKTVAQKAGVRDGEKIITHDNLRGSNAFLGGGINA